MLPGTRIARTCGRIARIRASAQAIQRSERLEGTPSLLLVEGPEELALETAAEGGPRA